MLRYALSYFHVRRWLNNFLPRSCTIYLWWASSFTPRVDRVLISLSARQYFSAVRMTSSSNAGMFFFSSSSCDGVDHALRPAFVTSFGTETMFQNSLTLNHMYPLDRHTSRQCFRRMVSALCMFWGNVNFNVSSGWWEELGNSTPWLSSLRSWPSWLAFAWSFGTITPPLFICGWTSYLKVLAWPALLQLL